MTISQSSLFRMALGCIPSVEKVLQQMITLYEGDLYFISSTKNSWFRISSFMESDSNFKMTAENLNTILSLGGVVSATSVDGNAIRKRFTSGSAKMDSGVLSDIEPPALRIPEMDTFTSIPKLLIRASAFNSMADEATRMSSMMLTTGCAAYMLENRKAICGLLYYGDETILEGNFTNNFEAINEIAKSGGSFSQVRDMLYLNVDLSEDQSITTCMKLSPPLATQEAKLLLTRFVADNAFTQFSHIKCTIDVEKYKEIIHVVSYMKFNGSVKYIVTDGELTVHVVDSFRREYEHTIPCESSGGITFESFLIGAPHLKVLSSVLPNIKKNNNAKMVVYLMPAQSKMIVTTQDQEEEFFPFVLLPMKVSDGR